MRRAVQDYAARQAVDIWQFEWLPYMVDCGLWTVDCGEVVDSGRWTVDASPSTVHRPLSTTRRVVVAHNVETLLWKRYHATAKGLARRLFLRRQWRRMERYERTHYRQAS